VGKMAPVPLTKLCMVGDTNGSSTGTWWATLTGVSLTHEFHWHGRDGTGMAKMGVPGALRVWMAPQGCDNHASFHELHNA